MFFENQHAVSCPFLPLLARDRTMPVRAAPSVAANQAHSIFHDLPPGPIDRLLHPLESARLSRME
jgi:hypothetical protein